METSIISKLWATHALGKTETMKDDSRTLRGLKRKQFLLAEGEGKVAKLSNSLCPVDPGEDLSGGVQARLILERIGQAGDHMGNPALVQCWMTQE